MTSKDAKRILSTYTLADEPGDDPSFRKAKEMLAADSELAAWWEEQRKTDQAVRDRLSQTPVPADLRAALSENLADQRRIAARRARIRKWSGLAASFLMAAYLFFHYGIDRSDDYTGPLPSRAYAYSSDGIRLSYFDRDPQKLQEWLEARGVELPDHLPPKLLALEAIGCRTLEWAPSDVALLCFDAETVYHLFVARKEEFPANEVSQEFDYEHYADGWTISQWTDGDFVFVLTGKTTQEEMSDYLASYNPSQS